MEQQTDNETMEYLKALILQQIKSQEEANKSFKKILRRITVFSVIMFAVLVMMISDIIYVQNRPESKVNEALKTAKDLETRISLQRDYININSNDIRKLSDSSKTKKK